MTETGCWKKWPTQILEGIDREEELPYAYGNVYREPFVFKESDRKLSDSMVKYFTNFAKTGNPNGEGLPVWENFSEEETKVMGFGEEISEMENPFLKVYAVIDKYQNEQR